MSNTINMTGEYGAMNVYMESNPQKFFDLPEWLEQRDHEGRVDTANVQVMFKELKLDHLVVVTAVLTKQSSWEGKEYKKGWRCKLDAHTRAEYWNSPKLNPTKPEKLLVIEYRYDTLKEISEAYFRHNSHDSVETTADKYRGIMKKMNDLETGKRWKRLSAPFKTGNVATLMNAAHVELFDFMYPGKNNRGMDSVTTDGTNTKSVMKDKLRRRHFVDFEVAVQTYDYFINKGKQNGTIRTIKDPAFGAALLMYFWLYGSEEFEWESIDHFVYDAPNGLNKNVRIALEKYICTETYKGDPKRVGKNGELEVHMGYPVNRIIRDCQPAPGPHDKPSIYHPSIIKRLAFGHISEAVSQAFCDIMAIHSSGACKERKLPTDTINETRKVIAKNPWHQEAHDRFRKNGPVNWSKQFSSVVTNDDDESCYEEDE